MLGRFFGGSGEGENSIDINQDVFNPESMTHHAFIDSKIKAFEGKRDELFEIDKKMGYAAGADAFLFVFSSGWGSYLSLVGAVAIYMALPKYLGRNEVKEEFDSLRDELFDLYRWTTKDQSVAITNQCDVLALLKTIVPFVKDCHKLVSWDLSKVNYKEVSKEFLEIVAKAPRGVQYVLSQNQAISMPTMLADLMRGKNKEVNSIIDDNIPVEKLQKASELYKLFSDGKARLINYEYGRNVENKEQSAVQLKNGI